jgi:DUF4097 and DUF4098 domain-containing protein YvlB
MRYALLIFIIGATASAVVAPRWSASRAQTRPEGGAERRERDEVRRTFRLAPGTRVEVSGISGTVEVRTADTDVAEVLIVRSAESRADLERDEVGIENGAQGLTIRGGQRRREPGNGFGPDVLHQVTLRLPRRLDLSVGSVSGRVQVGDVDGRVAVSGVGGAVAVGDVGGQVQVSNVSGGVAVGRASRQVEIKSVSGNVRVGQVSDALSVSSVSGEVRVAGVGGTLSVSGVSGALVAGALAGQSQVQNVSGGVAVERVGAQTEIKSVGGNVEIGESSGSLDVSGISGNLSVGVAKLGEDGARIKGVSGQLELRFRGRPNAQLSTDNISGQVSLDVPDVTIQSRPGAGALRAKIGAGGAPIAIDGVNKDVRLAWSQGK